MHVLALGQPVAALLHDPVWQLRHRQHIAARFLKRKGFAVRCGRQAGGSFAVKSRQRAACSQAVFAQALHFLLGLHIDPDAALLPARIVQRRGLFLLRRPAARHPGYALFIAECQKRLPFVSQRMAHLRCVA